MQAMYNRHPWGEIRTDTMLAQICQCLVAAHLKSGATMPELVEFMLFTERPKKTDADLIARFEHIVGKGK